METVYRNKNRDKTLIDYDLNIFSPEQWNEHYSESYYNPALWAIQVYECHSFSHHESDEPFFLNQEEIDMLGLNVKGTYWDGEVDTWYGMDGFKLDFWSKLSDRIKEYLEKFPKYYEDVVF